MHSCLHWWNREMRTPNAKTIPRTCPYPSAVIPIWKRNFPQFLKIDSFKKNERELYWPEIVKIVKKYMPKNKIPDPFTQFDEFVKILFDLKQLISPVNVEQVCMLIERHDKTNINKFIVYELPLVMHDPVLYINTIFELMRKDDSIWKNLSHSIKYNKIFFGMYCSFLRDINPETKFTWDYVLKIMEIMKRLLIDLPRNDSDFIANSRELLKSLVDMAKIASTEIQVTIVCAFFRVLKISKRKIELTELKTLYNEMLENIDPNSYVFPIYFQYSINSYKRTTHISMVKILKALRRRRVTSYHDFIMYYQLINHRVNPAVLSSIAKNAITNPAFMRTGFRFILKIFVENKKNREITEWGTVFIRRMVIYPLLSSATDTYTDRATIILEFLSSFSRAIVNKKIINQFSASVASIMGMAECPSYVWNFIKSDGIPDRMTQKEFKAFMERKRIKSLMDFYPFNESSFEFLKPFSSKKAFTSSISIEREDITSCIPKTLPDTESESQEDTIFFIQIPDDLPALMRREYSDPDFLEMLSTIDPYYV
jgi:hypothetical protein